MHFEFSLDSRIQLPLSSLILLNLERALFRFLVFIYICIYKTDELKSDKVNKTKYGFSSLFVFFYLFFIELI